MNNNQTYLLLALILVLGLSLRLAPIITTQGTLREPDSYYYLSILKQSSGLKLPQISSLDNVVPAEALGLYEIALIPHVLTGISIYNIMLFSAPIWGIIACLLTFILADQIFSNKKLALIATFLVAVLPAGLSLTTGGSWRGDSFISVFALLSLIFLVQTLKSSSRTKKVIYSIISALAISLAALSWSGGLYVAGVYLLATLELGVLYIIIKRDQIKNIIYPILTLILFAGEFLALQHIGWIYKSVTYPPTTVTTRIISNANIQETLPPTAGYVVATFGFLAVLGPAIFLGLSSYPAIATLIMTIVMVVIYAAISSRGKPKEVYTKDALLIAPLFSYLIVTFYLNALEVRFVSLSAFSIAIFMAYFIYYILEFTKPFQKIVVPFIIIIVLFSGAVFVYGYRPANDITPSFISTLNWLKANTPSNATVVATWPDASEVEGLSTRFSYADSVSSSPYQASVSQWFVTNESLPQFIPKPNYILLRGVIFNESVALCEIAGINTSYCSKLNNTMFLNNTKPNFYVLWKSCNMSPCHIIEGNTTYFLEYFENDTKIYLIDMR